MAGLTERTRAKCLPTGRDAHAPLGRPSGAARSKTMQLRAATMRFTERSERSTAAACCGRGLWHPLLELIAITGARWPRFEAGEAQQCSRLYTWSQVARATCTCFWRAPRISSPHSAKCAAPEPFRGDPHETSER